MKKERKNKTAKLTWEYPHAVLFICMNMERPMLSSLSSEIPEFVSLIIVLCSETSVHLQRTFPLLKSNEPKVDTFPEINASKI